MSLAVVLRKCSKSLLKHLWFDKTILRHCLPSGYKTRSTIFLIVVDSLCPPSVQAWLCLSKGMTLKEQDVQTNYKLSNSTTPKTYIPFLIKPCMTLSSSLLSSSPNRKHFLYQISTFGAPCHDRYVEIPKRLFVVIKLKCLCIAHC